MDKAIDKPQGLLPGLNIKGISQDSKYSQREDKRASQEKRKALPRKEKISLSLQNGKDNKEKPERRKAGIDKRDKRDELPADVRRKQIDITI